MAMAETPIFLEYDLTVYDRGDFSDCAAFSAL